MILHEDKPHAQKKLEKVNKLENKDKINLIISSICLILLFIFAIIIYDKFGKLLEKDLYIKEEILKLNQNNSDLNKELLQNTCLENGYESYKIEYSTNKYVLCNPPIWDRDNYDSTPFYKVIKIKKD